MTRSLRSRFPLIAALAVAAAVPAIALAAPSSVTVRGPSKPEVGQRFSVGAKGHAHKKLVLQVTIHRHGKCRKTYGEEKDSGSYIAFARFVGPGEFNEKRSGLRFTAKTNGHYCAYLGRPKDSIYDPPVRRSDKHFQVVHG